MLGNVYWTFNLQTVFAFLRPWKCFIPQRELRKQNRSWSNCFYVFFILVSKRLWLFQNYTTTLERCEKWVQTWPWRPQAPSALSGANHLKLSKFSCAKRLNSRRNFHPRSAWEIVKSSQAWSAWKIVKKLSGAKRLWNRINYKLSGAKCLRTLPESEKW